MGKRKNKKTKNTKKIIVGLIAFFCCLLVAFIIYMRFSPIRIGVLLNFSGSESLPYKQVLEWAKENSGRNVDFVYVDASQGDIKESARLLLEDHSVRIVIGPDSSDQAMAIAPLFIEKRKLLISPTATSADLYRAFAGKDYFWRTVESDVAQVRTIIELLSKKNVKNIALIYADTSYGKTFFDWTGFYATEFGMKVTSIQALDSDPDYEKLINNAINDNPQYIILATPPKDTVFLKRHLDSQNSGVKLFLTDINETDFLLQELGSQAENLEITGPASDPNSRFDESYAQKFGSSPPDFMASTYDSYMLAAAVLARQAYIHKYTLIPLPFLENVASSLKKILYHEEDKKSFQWDEVGAMFEYIADGNLPNLHGASGSIQYDLEKGVDPTSTFYAYSIVKNGEFVTEKILPSKGGDTSAAGTKASLELSALTEETTHLQFSDKNDLQAVIIATSDGWKNYRHQSDALAVYRLLKSNGQPDEKIHLFITDDVPHSSKNNPKGTLFHIKDGQENYRDAQIDFSGEKVSVDNFRDTLLNLESDGETNVLIFIAGHGGTFEFGDPGEMETSGDYLENEGIIPFANEDMLTSKDFKEIVEEMAQKQKFRQMLAVVETCYGGAMGQEIETPGVLFMSGASAQEVSYGANYSEKIDQWLADSFTYQFLEELKKNLDAPLADFYQRVYLNVPGSHVTLLNSQNFGSLKQVSIGSFFRP